ncbi:Uu.00g060020.m01.CDS01 [Anthostomella pinea]|uniref:Serine/threonine-protein kinase Tel1 n=1 Tax=Anthostomella pinea TaxID=933095 RepID=A0AAI8VS69_9PEZI|nr:Uu.00g060020.m01.CDS01 [Anthostomella pinea]
MAPRSGARELTLKKALELIESGSRTNGASGLEDLAHIFKHQSTASNLSALNDKSYHRLFEAIFRFAISEKEAYYKGKGSKPVATSRLVKCAEALRLSIEHGASKIKRKTVLVVIDHFTQTLPHPDDGLVPPLIQDYIKALCALLGNAANVELLTTYDGKGWYTCVDFTIKIITESLENGDRDLGPSRASPAPGTASMSLPMSTPRSTATSKRGSNSRMPRGCLPDLMQCLFFLVATPNAPLLQRSKDISSAVIAVLQLHALGMSPLHQLAFSVINSLIVTTQTDASAEASSLAVESLPLITYWWNARTASKYDALLNGVRTEMLKLLYNVQLQLEHLVKKDSEPALLEDIENLAEMFWSEYSRRGERAQLQQDDLAYTTGNQTSKHFQVQTFALRPFNVEGERQWGVVQNLAFLEGLIWKRSRSVHPSPVDDEQPRKKQRTAAGFSRLRQKLRSIDQSTQYTALQMIPFFVSDLDITVDEISELLPLLMDLVTNKNSKMSTWAMIACASLAPKATATEDYLAAVWKQSWQLAVRSVSMTGTCRASSALLHSIVTHELVSYRDMTDDINKMVTDIDVNCPAVLADSSLILMTRFLHLRNYHLPNASHATSNHIVRWMLSRWDPADANFISSNAIHVPPLNVVNVLRAAYGDQELMLPKCSQSIAGPIAETISLLRERESVVKYLLLLGDGTPETRSEDDLLNHVTVTPSATVLADTSSAYATKKLVAELFYPKLQGVGDLCDAWAKKGDGSTQITSERLQSVASCLIVGTLILPQLKEINTRQSQEMDEVFFKVNQSLLRAVSASSESQLLYESLLRSLRPYMPTLTNMELTRFAKEWPYLHQLFSELSGALRQRADKQSSGHDGDLMDLDDNFESQGSRASTASKPIEVSRRESSIVLQSTAFYIDTTQRLHFLEVLYEDNGQVGLVPPSFLDAFLELSDEEVLSCRCLIKELFDSDLIVNPDDAEKMIQRTGALIGQLAFSSCEVALNICLDLMEGFITIWADGTSELSFLVGDLYSHYLNKGLSINLLSQNVQMSLSRLLLHLAHVNDRFPESVKMPPPNTSLLSILESSSLPVKFYIGSRLPSIFGRYVLKLHEDMFVNVLENLPTDDAFLEGIALRLFVLAEIARQWPTLLRRGIYHIFETPGSIPQSKQHAAYCLKNIAVSLKLDDTRKLFDLFASQLLYTWFDEGTVENIPFEIFGFSSLQELLRRAQSEVVAILFMRDQEESISELATALGTTTPQLLQDNFSKTIAYSMAHDISIRKNEQQNRNGETRLRKLLGREKFLDGIYVNFADIIGLFVSLIDQEDPVERSWAKEAEFAYATETMANIKDCGHSDVVLGANQQPSFHAKYLSREISLLCSRTEYELSLLWTPALVVSVARKLLNGVHAALGPLHTCSIIRKVRVLMCLAGAHAWSSYALEMLLHSIRPFIVDSECADDAMGMSQYLLEKGSDALTQSPSFLAGHALSTLASLRVFLESTQSSTTQESQFKATMSKAQKFHSWFNTYLDKYSSPHLRNDKQRDAFKAITQSAAHVRSSGNAERGTHESRLLLEILQDEVDEAQLLNEPSRKLALEMLCRQFIMPTSVSNDILSSDDEAKALATAVWKSCQAQTLSDDYLAWAGRVIGRAFAASGNIDHDLLRESDLTLYRKVSLGKFDSEQGLLNLLQSLTTASDCFKAGLAESALRTILSEAAAQGDHGLTTASQQVLSDQLLATSEWAPYRTPPSDNISVDVVHEDYAFSDEACQDPKWAQIITVRLVQTFPDSIILSALPPILANVKGFAQEAFPYIVHLVLSFERTMKQSAKRSLSNALKHWLKLDTPIARENIGLLMNAVLYLRTQQLPGESSIADRIQWLDLDLSLAASAATRCGMYKTALLFVELASSDGSRSSRRSLAARAQESADVLLDIFENIDDPDAYYGLGHASSLSNVLSRLEYEKDGSKSLAFRGAQYDSHLRRGDVAAIIDSQSLVATLSGLGLSGLSHSLLQNQQSLERSSTTVETTFSTARKLEIWNLPAPKSTHHPSVTIYKAYQAWNQAVEMNAVRKVTYDGFSETMRNVIKHDIGPLQLRQNLGALAVLAEVNDTIDVSDPSDLDEILTVFGNRSSWMKSGRYEDVRQILSCRDTTLSMLSKTSQLRSTARVKPPEARLVQVKSMLLSAGLHRYHQAFQESLNIATSLTDLVPSSTDLGLYLDSAARVEAADSLWDHGEMLSSIHMLQSIDEDTNLKKQTIPLSRPDLLAKTAYQVSVARLEKPDSIQKKYLQPALKELKGRADGREAGKVYHQFAMFCDEQLQNPDGLEDLARLQHLRQGKNDEVTQLQGLYSSARDTQTKARYNNHLKKAEKWLELDEQELRRVEQSRSEFVRLSLENYLLSLIASDDHDNDALRFTALWLERSGESFTNEAVRKYIDKVATRKFAPLMNQLTSRLLDQGSLFQKLLLELVYRICVDHPYHGMYQIWSGHMSRPKKEDEAAQLRRQATQRVAKRLAQTEASAKTWSAINGISRAYHVLAVEGGYKGGQKVAMRDSAAGSTLASSLAKYHIPPPTMQIELSANLDYTHVPTMTKLEPSMTIASGVSAPKIITIVGSNGERFKQLVKGGNDDLRQDAIMEQVFAAVSSVLKLHRSTRQRNLGIRTYKVLPLTNVSGLIEFVSNTIPLHDYLMPAHERYHPKDLRGSQCRKEISGVQEKSAEVRVATYKKVTERFQPVMRYFFMENFVDPDEWFAKRTAYTRTTAAISMLGHVLGLGDRHGHNILLDSKNGEVVHIDLGVAFETGRVLPVPELVPFRLTRDIVDGMGITKTEGVFRRCCEFTLDALREETYSIMTILDVLRYDPLHSWSISPVRVAKLQDTRRDEAPDETSESVLSPRRKSAAGAAGGVVNEPSEADRALEVVRKKLSKTLSVTATVNDLINQATDERNLASLYSGWAAYA